MFDLFSDAGSMAWSDSDDEKDPGAAKDIALKRSHEDNSQFWLLLKTDRNKIKDINGSGELAAGVTGIGDGASIFVSAKKLGEGSWQLSTQQPGTGQKTFLLNYVRGKVTCVKRTDYETSHDFFLTVALSGCRFTLTNTHALHIAADAGDGAAGRDAAENFKLNVVPRPKRSVSVTSREGSILYHASTGAALAHIAQREATTAMLFARVGLARTDVDQIAQHVADHIRPLLPSKGTVLKAVVELKQSITGKGIEGAMANLICSLFGRALMGHIVAVSTMKKGAFVVGIKTLAGWNYYVLANQDWAEILPG